MIQYGIPTFILLPSYIYLIYSLWRRPVIGNVSQIRLERLKKTKKNLTTTIAAILFVQVQKYTYLKDGSSYIAEDLTRGHSII